MRGSYLRELAKTKDRDISMWAWLGQRLSGIGLTIYLLVHILVISTSLGGVTSFDSLLTRMQTPTVKLLDLGLLALVLGHGINGIRLLILDLGIWVRHQKYLLYGMIVVGVIIFLLTSYFLITFLGGL